jgi:sulfonate transport system substrate-binding protein
MMKFFYLRLSLLIFSLILSISGCSGRSETLSFAYQDRVGDAAAILAARELEKDDRFTLHRFSSGALTAEALISGSADAATMGDAAAVALAARYPGLVVLLGVHGSGAGRHKLVSPVDRPAVIGVKFGTSTHAALSAWLDYPATLIDLPPDLQLSALAAGEVAAIAASEPTPSLALSKLPGMKARSLEVPGRVYPLVLAANRRSLEKKPALLNELVSRITAGGEVLSRPLTPETLRLLETVIGLEGEILVSSLGSHSYGFSSMSHHRGELEELAAFLAAQGRIPAPPGSDVYGYSGDFR